MNFISYAQLWQDVLTLDAKLPRDIAGVVGVPRSGMVPAGMLALHRNLPLTSVCRLNTIGDFFDHGPRLASRTPGSGPLLVIDDSIYLGSQLQQVRDQLSKSHGWREFIYAAVYGCDDTPELSRADVVALNLPKPRAFAWNLFHSDAIDNAMIDMDGVLCWDPPMYDDGVGGEYEQWLPNAQPLHLPSRPLKAICTNRLSMWRDVTSAWLARHGIKTHELFMAPWRSPEKRHVCDPSYSAYKAKTYALSDCTLFIESDDLQAKLIASHTKKPVLSLAAGVIYSAS